MNGDTAEKADALTDTTNYDQEKNVKDNILTSDSLDPGNDKQANGHDSVNTENSKSDEITSDDVTNNPDNIAPIDEVAISTNNPSDDNTENPEKVTSDANKDNSCNLNCEEKVVESDTDPLAPQSSDSERTEILKVDKERLCSPLNDDGALSVNSESDEDELLCLGESTPNSDIILIDGDQQNGNSEVHEILSDDDNDDCIVTSEQTDNTEEMSLATRRNRRTKKKKSYYSSEDEQESDLEVIPMDDPLNNGAKIKNQQKRLIASGKRKAKKSPAILVVDPMDIVNKKDKSSNALKNKAVDSKKLHENIAACGTTITPITAKDNATVSYEKQPVKEPEPILPSLTDDMFVVEAPSFIVPYVYEKPADVHFRKFVDKLGVELEEQKAKEEELQLQKEKEEKEKREKEIEERKERGEDYSDLLEDNIKEKESKEEERQKKKQLKEERRRKRKAGEEDDPAWEADNVESSSSEDISDDEVKARDEEVAIPSTAPPPKIDSYFDTTLGKFFIDIGMNLVQEHVQCDLLKQENRKLSREKRGGYNTKATQSSIAALTNNLEKSKEKNALYKFTFEKCKLCSFKTDSSIVMANHMEVPHMKNNMFVCNFCLREMKGCHDILVHMLLNHEVKGRLERTTVSQQCSTCPYEDNNKARMGRHVVSCMKKFRPDVNLATFEWEPPAKIPKLVKTPSNAFLNNRGIYAGLNMSRPATITGNNPFQGKVAPQRTFPRPNILTKTNHASPKQIIPPPKTLVPPNIIQRTRTMEAEKGPSTLAISPLPSDKRETTMDNSFVMCEICDGYIKDLDQLRNHMLWIHKIKIHPKMIHNRPPLNCQKCQFRFFTDQGLERHLLGAHGLVTNSMQEAANSRRDCGRCPICGRVYQYKLLGHVARDHNMTLKPAHLSYKCTVCTATFDTYKEFESHVYSAHRVVTKRLAEKAKVSEPSK